jgi:glutaredoxin
MYLIYGRSSCPYTQRALTYAKSHNLPHKYVDLTKSRMSQSHRAKVRAQKHMTVPAIFVSVGNNRYKFVGGSENFISEGQR